MTWFGFGNGVAVFPSYLLARSFLYMSSIFKCASTWMLGVGDVPGYSKPLGPDRPTKNAQKCNFYERDWMEKNSLQKFGFSMVFLDVFSWFFMVILYPLWAPMPCWWVWPAQVGFCRPFNPRSIFVVCELRSLRRLTRPMVVLRLVCVAETWKSHFRSTQYIQVRGSQGTIGNKYSNILI